MKILICLFPRAAALSLILLLPAIGCKAKEPAAVNNQIPEAAERALRESPQVVLVSIDPTFAGELLGGRKFHGYRYLGETSLSSPEKRQQVVQTLRQDVSRWNGVHGLCFLPRHALRATSNGTTYDFLVCYECWTLVVYAGDGSLATIGITGSDRLFNEVLRAAKVALADPPDKAK